MKRATLVLIAALLPLVLLGQETTAPARQDSKDKGTIVFFRERHFTGSALQPSIYVDDNEVARMTNGRWFSVTCEPGKHELRSSAKNQPATVVEVAAGQTIHVQMIIATGTWRGGGRLLQVKSTEAEAIIAKLKPLNGKD